MIAVRRPVFDFFFILFAAHYDDRIEKAPKFGHDGFELPDVSVREIALVRRWLYLRDGKLGQDQPMSTETFLVRRENFAAILFNEIFEVANVIGFRRGRQFLGLKPDGFSRELSPFFRRSGCF